MFATKTAIEITQTADSVAMNVPGDRNVWMENAVAPMAIHGAKAFVSRAAA